MWFWSLWLIGNLLVVAFGLDTTNPPGTTTLDPITEQLNDINEKLKHILTPPWQGETSNNQEFADRIEEVREASKWTQNRLSDKVRVHLLFIAYNRRRMELEREITERVVELTDEIIPRLEQDTKCAAFYRKQRDALRKAFTSSNDIKMAKIKENSVKCPHGDDDDDDSDEFDDLMFSDAADSGSAET